MHGTFDGHPVAIHHTGLDDAGAHRVVSLHHIDIKALGAAQHGRLRNCQRVLQYVQQQAHIDRLIWEQRVIGIGEDRFDLDGVGAGIDGVVYCADTTGGQLLGATLVPGLHRQRLFGSKARLQQGYLRRGYGKHQGDWPGLGDGHQTIGVGRLDHIAQIRLLQTDTPADGCHDFGV